MTRLIHRLGIPSIGSLLVLTLASPVAGADLQVIDIPATLSLNQALAIFRARGFDLLIAEAQIEMAEGDALAAAAVPNPSLSGGLSYSSFNDDQFDTHYGWSVGLGDSNAIEDTLSGKRRLRTRVTQAVLAAARMQRLDAQRTLELQVKNLYFQVLQGASSLEFMRDVAATAEGTFQLNLIRYQAGSISEVDLAKAETAKLEADQVVDATAQTLRQAKGALGFLLGRRRVGSDFAVDSKELRFERPPTLAQATPASLVELAFAARPDLQVQAHQRERAAGARALVGRLRFPDVGVGLQYQQQGSSTSANALTPPTLTVNLVTTLPVFYQQQGEIRKADADVRVQDVALAKTTAQVVADVETAFAAYETSLGLLERMQDRLLDRARRARDLSKLQYEKGAASLLEYLDAQRTFIATNTEYLQELAGYWTAIFQLEAATASELRP